MPEHVLIENCAISSKGGSTLINILENPAMSTVLQREERTPLFSSESNRNEQVQVKAEVEVGNQTLDSLSERYFKPDFLKIDIEGSDLEVLKTINLDEIKLDLLMIEASDFDKEGRYEIINYLQSKNYKILYDNKLNVVDSAFSSAFILASKADLVKPLSLGSVITKLEGLFKINCNIAKAPCSTAFN